jgi:hypothetical protein
LRVDFSHPLNLVIPLGDVVLIDAHGINPEPDFGHFFPRPYCIQELPKIFANMMGLSVDLDQVLGLGIAPGI